MAPSTPTSPEHPGRLRKRVALVAASGLALTAAAGATATSASAFTPRSTLNVVANGHSFDVSGPRNIQAGLVRITMQAAGGEQIAGLASFLHGWTFADYKHARHQVDSEFGNNRPQDALHELNVALRHVDFRGGLDAAPGHSASMTVRLAPGTYSLFSDTSSPRSPYTFTVFGSQVRRSHPTPTARVWATPKNRFAGDTVLPASGTIRFSNRSDYTPHFLSMQHVADGTTRADVLKALTGNQQPTFARPGTIGTDAINPGETQTLTYHLPAGRYAQMCFFPDPKTGMPHAFMGMVRMVTLK